MRRLLIAALAMALSGCASIMHGTGQDVGIASSPTNATVYVDSKPIGQTPITASLKRKDHHVVRLELEGYEPYETMFTRNVSGWVWGNIVIGGLIGLAVDAMTGGLYKLSPEQIHSELQKQGTVSLQDGDAIRIVVVLQPDPSWMRVDNLRVSTP